ncbi:MAG TPA: hypothetical protein VK308_14985, partial [Pyrinomonadaceae bacterium]|nr:hypothetical protein [Pyrinomonadaceae bacterium]
MDKIHQILQICSYESYAGKTEYAALDELHSTFSSMLPKLTVINNTGTFLWFYEQLKSGNIQEDWYDEVLAKPVLPEGISAPILYEAHISNEHQLIRSATLLEFFPYSPFFPAKLSQVEWFSQYEEAIPSSRELKKIADGLFASPFNESVGIVKLEHIKITEQHKAVVEHAIIGCVGKDRRLIVDDTLRFVSTFTDPANEDSMRKAMYTGILSFSTCFLANESLDIKDNFLSPGSWSPREFDFLKTNNFSFPKNYWFLSYDINGGSQKIGHRKIKNGEASVYKPHPLRYPLMRPDIVSKINRIHDIHKITPTQFSTMAAENYSAAKAEKKHPNYIFNQSFFDSEDELFSVGMYFLFYGSGRNIFSFEPKLIRDFQRSEISAVHLADLQFPFQAFYMSFGEIREICFSYLGHEFCLDGAYISHHHEFPLQILLTASNKISSSAVDQDGIVNPVFFFSFPHKPIDSWNMPVGEILDNLIDHQFSWESPDNERYR